MAGERKQQILQALAKMLESPKREKITTASLAKELGVSEAALYRHFANKAQMFEGLIAFIEETIFGLINKILDEEENGIAQIQQIIAMLISFSEKNAGMTRILIGDALVNEDQKLQNRINQLFDRIEITIKQCLKIADKQDIESNLLVDPDAKANLVVCYVIGRWHQFAKSGFKKKPSYFTVVQLKTLLS